MGETPENTAEKVPEKISRKVPEMEHTETISWSRRTKIEMPSRNLKTIAEKRIERETKRKIATKLETKM